MVKLHVMRTLGFICLQAPFFLAVLGYSSLWGAGSWFTRKNRALFATLSIAMWLPLLGLRVSAQANPNFFKTSSSNTIRLFLCTHQSFSDALVLALLLWIFKAPLGPGIALYKRELGKIPLLGLLQKFAGHIPVERSGDVSSAKRSLENAARSAREGYHISGFPEGARRRSPSEGKIGDLKKGFFHMILNFCKNGVPVEVFPVVFVGSFRSWPIGNLAPIPGSRIAVRVGEPVLFGPDCSEMSVEEAKNSVAERLKSEIDLACDDKLYSLDAAFKKGKEINYGSIFGFEMILCTLPVIASTLAVLFTH